MSACICIGPTTGDHLCPCRRRDEDARQAAKAQGVFSEWNACCYRDECRRRATDYAALQAKLDAVTKDAEALQARLDSLNTGEGNDPSPMSLAAAFHEYGEGITNDGPVVRAMQDIMFNARMRDRDTALSDQGRAGDAT